VIGEFRTSNKLNFMAQQLEPVIKVGKLRVHQRVLDNSKFMSQLEEFPYMKHDDCIDATAMAISKLPEPGVDISKIPLIQSPLQMAGGRAKLTD
jgi:phage terminase large subunit-like protein